MPCPAEDSVAHQVGGCLISLISPEIAAEHAIYPLKDNFDNPDPAYCCMERRHVLPLLVLQQKTEIIYHERVDFRPDKNPNNTLHIPKRITPYLVQHLPATKSLSSLHSVHHWPSKYTSVPAPPFFPASSITPIEENSIL